MLKCPHCGSNLWRCWDERELTWWEKDGSMGAVQILGMLACLNCLKSYVDATPTDQELEAAGLWVDPEEQQSAWR